jgi:hypothetical protein
MKVYSLSKATKLQATYHVHKLHVISILLHLIVSIFLGILPVLRRPASFPLLLSLLDSLLSGLRFHLLVQVSQVMQMVVGQHYL